MPGSALAASPFNVQVDEHDGSVLLFNAASGTLAQITSENAPVIRRLLAEPDSAAGEEEQGFVGALTEGRFLVDGDELGRLRVENRRRRFGRRVFSLTLVPTLACNFRCDYCFERPEAARMSRSVEDAVVAFTERRLSGAEHLGVGWYGGEPLLAVDTIERLQERLQALCAARGVHMHPSGVVTNGYLLDGAMAERLKRAGVGSAQVTLDGPREVHDARRKLAGGGPTFERIAGNLVEASTILACSLRVNVDRDNVAAAVELVEELGRRGLLGLLPLSFAAVEAVGAVCGAAAERCFGTEEYARRELEIHAALLARGVDALTIPGPVAGCYCDAESESSFVVDPEGRLYKCWEAVGDERAVVGTVLDDERSPEAERLLTRLLARDPLDDARCRACSLLPACMGGCVQQALRASPGAPPACPSAKLNLVPLLRLRAAHAGGP